MPFVNKAQYVLCLEKERQAKKLGKKSSWNCAKWKQYTPMFKSLPIHKGVRNGIYKICPLNGKKIYKS